jgi:hypothetical protein
MIQNRAQTDPAGRDWIFAMTNFCLNRLFHWLLSRYNRIVQQHLIIQYPKYLNSVNTISWLLKSPSIILVHLWYTFHHGRKPNPGSTFSCLHSPDMIFVSFLFCEYFSSLLIIVKQCYEIILSLVHLSGIAYKENRSVCRIETFQYHSNT